MIKVMPGDPYITLVDDDTAGKAEITESTAQELYSLYPDEKMIVSEWMKEQAEAHGRKR